MIQTVDQTYRVPVISKTEHWLANVAFFPNILALKTLSGKGSSQTLLCSVRKVKGTARLDTAQLPSLGVSQRSFIALTNGTHYLTV